MDVSFIAHLLNALLMIAMPVGLAIFLTRKLDLYGRLWWIGAATFILSQIGHLPFNFFMGIFLNRTSMVLWTPTTQLIFNAIFLGLSAGLWEELFRFGMFRWWAKDARSWKEGVLAGAGHGGAEAIILGALAINWLVNMTTVRNADLSNIVSPDQLALAQQQVLTYWSTPWYGAMLGALERAFTIPIQISMAVIVLQTFIRKQWFWVWLAVLYHALIDGVTTVIAPNYLNAYWTEALIGLFAVISVVLIFVLRRPGHKPAPASFYPSAPAGTGEN